MPKGGQKRTDKRTASRFRTGTWNVFSLTVKKRLEFVEEAKRYRLDILGVSSTKNRGVDIVDLPEGWKLFCFGVDPALVPQAGVGIRTSPRLSDKVVGWTPLGGRMAVLKLRLKRSTLAVVQVYAPNDQSEYASFLLDVEAAMKIAAEADNYILMGDFNAHVGNDSGMWRGVVGRNGDPAFNSNGERLLEFCCAHGMTIMNTFFQHRDVHKYTWYRDTLRQKSIIDFVMVPLDMRRIVCDVRVMRGAELSTDHHLVVCELNLDGTRLKPQKRRVGAPTRVMWEKLQNEEVR